MKIFKLSQNAKKNLFYYGIIAVSLAFLLPLILLSFYNHPGADDFSYSFEARNVWVGTHSIFAVLAQAVKTSIWYWHNWQGLYSSAFLLALQPSIFGESAYAFAGIFILLVLCASTVFFAWYMLHRRLSFATLPSVALGFLVSLIEVQWMPDCAQGVYWFNGAGNYTFFYGVLLVLAVACTSVGFGNNYKNDNASKNTLQGINWCKFIVKIVLTAILAFILSGGNHVTAFLGFLMVLGIVVYGFWFKKMPLFAGNILPLIASAFGLVLNFKAPGTAVRQAQFASSGMSFAKTIVNSTFHGFENADGWFSIPLFLGLLIAFPVFYNGAKALADSRKCKFNRPLLVVVLALAWPCLMHCPPFYAMGHQGDGRLLNVVYFSIVMLAFVQEFYICGYIASRTGISLDGMAEKLMPKSKLWFVFAVLFALFSFFCFCGRKTHGFTAFRCIANGIARQYDAEADARDKTALASAGEDVVFEPFSVYPGLLYLMDLSVREDDWPNNDYAKYYSLKSVKLSAPAKGWEF